MSFQYTKLFTWKTTPTVTVVERTGTQAHVYLDLVNLLYEGNTITIPVKYYWKEQVPTGKFDQNNDPIMKDEIHWLPPVPPVVIPRAQAIGIELLAGTLQGAYHFDKLDSLIKKGTELKLDQDNLYGLTSQDWTLQTS